MGTHSKFWPVVVAISIAAHSLVSAREQPPAPDTDVIWTEPPAVLLEFDDSEEAEVIQDANVTNAADAIAQPVEPEEPPRSIFDSKVEEPELLHDRSISLQPPGYAQPMSGRYGVMGRHSQPVFSEPPVYEEFAPAPAAPACSLVCPPFWQHRTGIWGEYLFLRPRGTDVVYASTVDGTLATSVPVADRSVSAFGYDSGVRAGLGWALSECSSITASYTWYENTTIDSVGLAGGGAAFIAAETVHFNTLNVAADSLSATAFYDIQLQSADLNYKGLMFGSDNSALNYVVGIKYARLEQDFQADYTILGTTNVNTNVNFDGLGPRLGFDGEYGLGCGFIGYSKGTVNLLVGTSTADFTQTNIFTGLQARTGLEDSRIVTVPELELGAGWQSRNGCFRITAGYYLAAWFNMLTTPEYINTVRVTQNTFQHEVRTLTLDGLSARIDFRF